MPETGVHREEISRRVECRLPATELQRLPWTAWRRAHASVNGSEGKIKVAESRVVLSNLRLADSLTQQACDVFEGVYASP